MFGYIVANFDALSPEEKAHYRACYCGLCKALGEQHSMSCRATLTYDMTFLVLLLSAMTDEQPVTEQFTCPAHPLKKQASWQSVHTTYAADLNVVLSYMQLMDDWQDDRNALARMKAKVIGRHVDAVRERLPRQCAAMDEGLKQLSRYERDGEVNPDLPANAFGYALSEAFVPDGIPQPDTLRDFGWALGRFIYLMDAAVDLKDDIRKERYNPLTTVPSDRHESLLQSQMSVCTALFEQLAIKRDKALIENILYSGVWTRYRMKTKGSGAHERSV